MTKRQRRDKTATAQTIMSCHIGPQRYAGVERIAENTGIKATTLRGWFSRGRGMRPENAEALADELGVPLVAILRPTRPIYELRKEDAQRYAQGA